MPDINDVDEHRDRMEEQYNAHVLDGEDEWLPVSEEEHDDELDDVEMLREEASNPL